MLPESSRLCLTCRWARFYLVESSLHLIPEFLGNNAPFGNLGDYPFNPRIDTSNASARGRVFGEPLAVPYKLPDVDFVAQDAAASTGVSSDRCVRPSPPAGASNPLQIELASDCPRRLARREGLIDPTDRFCFALFDDTIAAQEFTAIIKASHHSIAIWQ